MTKKQATAVVPAGPGRYIPFILAIVAALVYANSLRHGFVLDDVAVIGKNKFVHDGIAGLPKILTTFYWQGYWDLNAGLYRPLSLVMFAIEWQISPGNPFIHHLVQVLLYAFVIVQLYRFLVTFISQYNAWLPAAITLLFALHPIHTEVVANIKSRDELLCFLFFLLTANELLQKQRVTILAIVYYSLCLLSKEAGILYLPVFLLLQVQFGGKALLDSFKALLPLAAVAVLWLCWHYYVTHSLSPGRVPYTRADNSLLACTDMVSRLAAGLTILGTYMAKSVWPYNMSYDYSFNEVPCDAGFTAAAAVSLLVCVGLLYATYKNFRKTPVLSFGILYFFCTIIFASNVFYIIGTTMGDRLLFAPVLGSMICICWLVYRYTGQLASQKMMNTAMIVVVAAGLVFSVKTIARNNDWASDATLFEADVPHAPGSARVYHNYGTAIMQQLSAPDGDKSKTMNDAVELFSRAVAIDTAYRDAYVNLGAALYKSGHYPEAIAATQRALKLAAEDSSLMLTIGDCYFMMKRYDDAIAVYRRSLQKGMHKARTYTFWGTALFSQQKYEEAIAVFKEGLSHDTTDAELWGNYGNALGVTNRYDEAIAAFTHSLQIKPNQKSILYFISITYRNKGDIAKADEYLKRSQAL